MRFYGWENTKTNRLLGAVRGGNWRRVCFVRYLYLTLFGFITTVMRGHEMPTEEPK